jgi:hypothetical protein
MFERSEGQKSVWKGEESATTIFLLSVMVFHLV